MYRCMQTHENLLGQNRIVSCCIQKKNMEFKTRRRIHDAMRRIQKSRELAKPRGSVVGRVHNAAERLRGHHPADVSGTGFVPSKGTEVEAKIGSQGNYRRCVVVKTPKHQRWVNGKRICVFF